MEQANEAAGMISIVCDKSSDTPIYRQIVRQVKDAVGSGALAGEQRLPTTRWLAQRLGVNRLTVGRAYAELAKAGIISSHVGRGTFVRAPEKRTEAPKKSVAARFEWSSQFAESTQRALESGLPAASTSAADRSVISFASLFPDSSLFPTEAFRRALDDVLRKQGHRVLGYGPPAGHAGLRELIAANLRSRGMRVTMDEIVITNGSQQGIDLAARVLLDPSDVVLVENPTYPAAVQVFRSYGASLVGVPVDHEGIQIGPLEEAVSRHRPKLIYLMPNFQNPTSETLSLARRRAIVALASSKGIPVLEDDFGGDLRFEGPDLPTLKALDETGNVIYLSTFAKKLLPGIRIGWIAAPREVAERLTGLKKITDYSTSLLLQAALFEFCGRGNLDRHLSGIVERYRERRDAILSAMKRSFPASVTWSRPRGGLAVWVTLPAGVDAAEVTALAETRKVLVGRGDFFHVSPGNRQNLRLTYSQVTPREISRGIRILGEIITQQINMRRAAPRHQDMESLPLI